MSAYVDPIVFVFIAIITAIIFWPMAWLFAKFLRKTSHIVIAGLVFSIIAAPILYFVLILGGFAYSNYYPSKTFTPEAWQAADWRVKHGDNIPPSRYLYSKDLIERRLLIGKSKREVVEILGEGYDKGNILSYDLGFVPGHGIDPDVLEIYFENDVVSDVRQRRT